MFATSFLEQSRRDKILVTPHKRRRSAVWGWEGETAAHAAQVTPHKRRRSAVWGLRGGDHRKSTKERSVGTKDRRPMIKNQ